MPKMTQFPLSPPRKKKKKSPLKGLLGAGSVPSPPAPVAPSPHPPASCVYSCSPLIIHIPAASLCLRPPPPPCLSRSLFLSPPPFLPPFHNSKACQAGSRLLAPGFTPGKKNKAKEKGMQGKTAPPHEHTSNQPFISPECSPRCRAPYPGLTHACPRPRTPLQHQQPAAAHAPARKSEGANTRSIIYQQYQLFRAPVQGKGWGDEAVVEAAFTPVIQARGSCLDPFPHCTSGEVMGGLQPHLFHPTPPLWGFSYPDPSFLPKGRASLRSEPPYAAPGTSPSRRHRVQYPNTTPRAG